MSRDVVFLVWHVRETSDEQDDEKLIGVYGTEQGAMDAIARAREKPGFKDFAAGFLIEAYEVNKDHWTEGFVPVQ